MAVTTKIDATSVGDFLRQARQRAGFTQSDVAINLGLAASYPSHDETGQMPVPPARLKSLATMYNLSKAESKALLDLAAEQAYKRLDISHFDVKSVRKVLETIYAES